MGRRWAVWGMVWVGVVACGGGGDGDDLADGAAHAADGAQPDAPELDDAAPRPDQFVTCDGCNPVSQMGCGAGEKCTDGPGCGPQCAPDGTVAVGGDCLVDEATGIDDCVAGTFCVSGTCSTICTSIPSDSCPEGSVCVHLDGPFRNFSPGAGVCLGCDALADDACPEGQSCYLSTEGWSCAPPADGAAAGEPCGCPTCCQAGLLCLPSGAGFACAAPCDHAAHPGAADPRCAPGEVCCGPVETWSKVGSCAESCE